MATIEVEKLIRQLEPEYLQALAEYVKYLIYQQKKQVDENGNAEKKPVAETKIETVNPSEEDIPERLRIARQFKGRAPYPHFPVTKYDVYDQ